MVSAPVGFMCPECAGVRPAPARLAARGANRPVVTYVLIAINLAVFAVQWLLGVDGTSVRWGMWPVAIAVNGEWWRLITGAFLHGGLLHLALNMYVLFVIGAALERLLGHGRYIALYLVSALGGCVASYALSDLRTVSVGASGAIFGVMGALLVAGRLRYDIRQILVLLAINVAVGFIFPGIDWRAHLGGLVTGAAVAAVFTFAPRRGRVWWQIGGVAAVVAALIAVTAWRTAALLDYIAPLGTTSV